MSLTETEITNASTDIQTIGQFVNNSPTTPNTGHANGSVTNRTGTTFYNLQYIIAQLMSSVSSAAVSAADAATDRGAIAALLTASATDRNSISTLLSASNTDRGSIATALNQTNAIAAQASNMGYAGRSARFPLRNRTAGSGSPFAMIAQPTTNMGTWFGADGTFMMSIVIPRERYRKSALGQYNYIRTLMGTNMGDGGVNAANQFAVSIAGDNIGGAAPLQSRISITMRSSGVTLIAAAGVLIPENTGSRLLLVARRTGNTYSLDYWDCDTGTKYAGTTYDATGFVGWLATNAGSYIQIGTGGVTNSAPAVSAFNPTIKFGWDGDIGLTGYYTGSLSDAACQNIALGVDLPTATTAANWKYVREFDGSSATLAKPSWASGDTTSAAEAVASGLEIERGSSIVSRGSYITIDRKVAGDAHVDAVIPGQDTKAVAISGKVRSLPANDDIEVRFLTTDGIPVTTWKRVASVITTDTTWSGVVNVPKSPVPYVRQARLASQKGDPTKWILDASRFGVGYRILVIGQSQIANLRGTGRGLVYKGQTRFSFIEQVAEAATDFSAANCLVMNERVAPIGDGIIGIMNAIDYAGVDAVCAVETQCVGGTASLDWINDSLSGRSWTPMLRSNEIMDGDRSCVIWAWDPADQATSYTQVLDAVFCGTGASASNHYVFGAKSDGGTQVGATVVYMPAQRQNGNRTTEGDSDDAATSGIRRDEGVAWALSKPFGVVGAAPVDLELQDSLHPSTSLASGTERHGQQIGFSAVRGVRQDLSTNPVIDGTSFVANGGRTTFDFKVKLPNFGTLTNGLGATFDNGADKAVRIIELSTDNITWSKSGFTAAISGRDKVTVTKSSGSWPTPAAATGTITFSAVGTEGDTITVAGVVFTLSATGSANNEVQIGATATATAQSFRDRVDNMSATLGVTASGTAAVITLSSVALSPLGNSITLAKSSSAVAVSGARLTGGAGLLARVGYGGFGSYGLPTSGITSGNTAARDYWMYDGYARHINGRGVIVLPTNTIYNVA